MLRLRPRWIRRFLFWLLPALVSLAGCSTLPSTVMPVDGRDVQVSITRHPGTVAVVFENGLDGSLDWWAKVYPDIASDFTALAYNRPGYGQSTPATTPRDAAQIVDELRQLLQAANLAPPYVLVGHSLGGLYMQWFLRRYPDEVAALVLVDSTHPRQMTGEGHPDRWPAWLRRTFEAMTSRTAKEEFSQIDASGQAILALPAPADKPVIVLSALKPMAAHSPFADDANAKRADIANLYPGARQIWVDSGHAMPLEAPDQVIRSIRDAAHAASAPHTTAP